MNKQNFRLIFNHKRGMLVAVSELVTNQGKGTGETRSASASVSTTTPLMRFAMLGVVIAGLFGEITVVSAQQVAYKNGGPQPIADRSANGIPVVQIVQPNGAGLSHNKYDSFSVDPNGVILNNSPTTVNTQLGGFIQGNSQINTPAKIILNEVLGTSRSQLNGYIEVAGQRAEVIVANPNGISVGGGAGFINTSRGVLTTGTPTFGGDGSLASFRVTKGDINIGAGGMNGTGADQLDLIARSVSVNDKLYANRLNVVTGANQVNYNDLGVTVIAGEGGQPAVAIDSSALGGMYAQKIMLVGNEHGVGVKLLGDTAASAGDVTISNDGKVTLNNKTNATGQIAIRSTDDVNNSGTLYAQQVGLNSAGLVSNSGTIAAQNDLNVNAASINSTGVLAAGIDVNGKATQLGNLVLNANGTLIATGQNTAGSNVSMMGSSLNLANANTSSNGATTLTATSGDINHSGGNLQAAGATTINATGAVTNNQGVINTAQLTINSGALSNVAGSLIQSGSGDTNISTTGTTNNTSGTIATNANKLILQSGDLVNDVGHITHAGSGTLSINTGAASNVAGDIATNGQLLLTAANLNNQQGSLIANRNAALNLTGNLNNTQGSIQAASALQANAANIDNTAGRITSLDNSGLTLSASGLLTNAAGTAADGSQGGVIGGNGDVNLTAANATNSGQITAGNNLTARVQNQLNNNSGRLAAANTLTAQAASLSNAQGALDAAKINATIAQLNNNQGKINADQITLHATNLSNQQGQIAQFGEDASTIDVTNMLDNSNAGLIQTNSADLTLTPQQLNNNGGTISHAGTGTLNVAVGNGALQNQGGTIGSNGTVNAGATSINNQAGTLFGAGATTITATAGDIDNSNGGYLSGDSLKVNATGNINNTQGKLEAIKSGLAINANSLNNAAGTIQNLGANALTINLRQGLSNTSANNVGGFIGSAGDVNVKATDIDNTEGTFYSKQNLSLNADGTLFNNSGVLQSDGSINATATNDVNNQDGRIEANGAAATLTVSGSSIDNTSGRIANSGTGSTAINGGSNLANDAGTIGGNGNLTLTSTNLSNTQQGQVISAADLTLAIANNINNSQGKLFAGQNLTVNQAGATLNNSAGNIASSGDTNLTVASIDNTNGQIGNTAGNGGNIALSTSGIVTNTAGNIGSDKNTTIYANTILGDGKVIAGQDASINLQGDYTNTAANQFTANRDLSFAATGTLTNAGNLEAVRNLNVSAANVTNQYGALINAGNGNTWIQASNTVYNIGRIYGDDVAIGAQSITNDGILNADGTTNQAGIIAARNDLDLGANTIVNREHATIISLGDMAFGGALDANHKATDSSASILNASATIDAGNNLNLQTANLTNRNDHFATDLVIDPTLTTHVTQYRSWDSNTWYDTSDVTWSDSGDGGIVVVLPGNSRYEKFYKMDYTQIVQKTVVTSSDPGQITSGNNMTLSGNVTNDKSTMIAGGTLGGQLGDLNNIGADGQVVTTNQMTAGENYYHWVDGHPHENHYTYDNNGAAYDVALPTTTFALPVWTVLDLTKPNQGDNGAIGSGVGNSTVPSSGSSTIGGNQGGQNLSGNGQTVGGASGSAGGNTGTSGNTQTVGTADKPLPNLTLPNSQLFPITQNPNLGYLIETDPKFTNYNNFISSDYMLSRLGVDPMATQKRLGDGYYEQTLINQQITELTGKRFLGDYTSNEQQYEALMDAGINYAQQFQLTPGIALSAEQMNSLTSDIVWLVSQNITLPDGTTQSVLVPVVYLSRLDAGDVSPTGSVMSGRNIDLSINGTLQNGGTLQSSNNTLIHATDINNTGTISSDAKTGTMVLVADNDLINGGTISGNRVGILAGRDVTMASTISSATSKNGTNIGISQVASVNADQLSIQSGRDINLTGTAINTTGDAAFVAGRDINLNTVTTQATSNVDYGNKNHLNETQTQAIGTAIQSGGNVTLAAGQDINANAAYVNADQNLVAAAGRDVNIASAEQTSSKDQEISTTSKGMLSSSSYHYTDQQQGTQAVGSTLSGDNVQVVAGRDVNVIGSNVVGTHDVAVVAGNNVNIVASQNTASESSSSEEKTSGLTSSGMSVSMGNKEQDHQQTYDATTHNASTVGSTNGNVTITAGNAYTQTGSNVVALAGDIGIAGKTVDITAVQDTMTATTKDHTQQSGLSLGVSAPIVTAVKTIQQMNSASSKTDDPRMKALAAAVTVSAAGDAATAAQNPTDGVTVSLTVGSSKSDSQSKQTSSAVVGSNVTAGGNVSIAATGAGQDSNINVIGSNITAGQNALLKADGDINLKAAQSSSDQHSTSSSSSAAVGIAATYGSNGFAFGITANAAGSRGNADGSDVTNVNTHVTAGNNLIIESGHDTNLIGAVASANQVLANVGTSGSGNLNITSLQDTSNYNSKDQNIGGSVTIGYGASGSFNAGQSKVNGDYASVGEQSGIKAGDGGFIVNVNGNTNLTGGVIASTATPDKNLLVTQTLTQSDIENHSNYDASSVSVGGGYGSQSGSKDRVMQFNGGATGTSAGFSSTDGNASGTSHSGVSAGTVVITDDAKQQQLIGQTAEQTGASINHDVGVDNAGSIGKNWDGQQLKDKVTSEAQITAAFGQAAAKEIGSYADIKQKEALANKDYDEAAKWAEGGAYRVALHTGVGALTGGVGGAAGAFASAESMSVIDSAIQNMGLPDAVRQGLEQVTAAAIGVAVGGGAGAAAGVNVEANNRQLHPTEIEMIKKNANRFAKELYNTDNPTPEQIQGALSMLANTAQNLVDYNFGYDVPYSAQAEAFLHTLQSEYAASTPNLSIGNGQYLFYATNDQKNSPYINSGTVDKEIAGVIIKAPIKQPENAQSNTEKRDPLTNLPLDDQGRYGQQVVVEGKTYAPKYFSCATPECLGNNLDMSDPQTAAYVKALDKKVLDDIGTGATYAALANPTGAIGLMAGIIGTTSGVASGYLDGKTGNAVAKEAVQLAAQQYLQGVYGIGEAAASRVITLIDLCGGWQAFVDRTQQQAKDLVGGGK
ncbi:hemagglutinin repeat-containing protein [Glaciimonas soli]|uniref:Filamentous hemagglutinin N-terminal domain-containing protein n=1 Tax=Glaciimonas soli TaxID=2590999 RepID=A0A843YLM0_9BURK|nr:hemagglutinin repeat-containing protein [Glaciimonas soli]MQQ99819.1 filamentous hemagglutinin N-terminal domain-containing protein [Glaciimonas soli]